MPKNERHFLIDDTVREFSLLLQDALEERVRVHPALRDSMQRWAFTKRHGS
jgi:hypothetical protein